MTNGLVVMTPSSVDITGGGSETSTTNADGSVSFSACASLSLNDVFTSDYDNYMIVWRVLPSAPQGTFFKLRVSGVDSSTGYVVQRINADSTTVSAERNSSETAGRLTNLEGLTIYGGISQYLFGPYLAQPTASRTVVVDTKSSARILDFATTHSVSTAYDGITLLNNNGTDSGLVTVFGFNQ
jgi:hypothetical protein